MTDLTRRSFLQAFGNGAALAGLVGAGMLKPGRVLAVDFDRNAFAATNAADALRLIGATGAESSTELIFKGPEVAENGAAVPVEVISRLPNTTRLSLLVDKNPFPLAAQFSFSGNAVARFQAKLKMAESSRVRVVAVAAGKQYTAFREIKVTVGGCGF